MQVSPLNGKYMALFPLIVHNAMQIYLLWNIYCFYNEGFEPINENSMLLCQNNLDFAKHKYTT